MVWFIVAAFMFALGHEKTRLDKRIAPWSVKAMGTGTLMLGYAVTIAEAVLAWLRDNPRATLMSTWPLATC